MDRKGSRPKSPSGAITTTAKAQPPSQFDVEWARFERDVLAQPSPSLVEPPISKKEIYDRATVVAEEEVLYDANGHEGFPEHLRSGTAADAAKVTRPGAGIEGEYVGGAPVEGETPEEAEARKVREEKELIMDRILEEERAQEDADEKVRAIKARLALVRKKREEERNRRAAGGTS